MAGIDDDHSAPKRTVDDVFQYLTRVLNFPPRKARQEILEKLQLEQLAMDFHVKGGVRSLGVVRSCTAEERAEEERTGLISSARYETTPLEKPVHPDSWGSLLSLRIAEGGKLVVEPLAALTWPWDAYSFTIANWSLVQELWPNPTQASAPQPAPPFPWNAYSFTVAMPEPRSNPAQTSASASPEAPMSEAPSIPSPASAGSDDPTRMVEQVFAGAARGEQSREESRVGQNLQRHHGGQRSHSRADGGRQRDYRWRIFGAPHRASPARREGLSQATLSILVTFAQISRSCANVQRSTCI
jgi:hypothetical protein